jgi:Tfp pilus assembly PilM family ATPase
MLDVIVVACRSEHVKRRIEPLVLAGLDVEVVVVESCAEARGNASDLLAYFKTGDTARWKIALGLAIHGWQAR